MARLQCIACERHGIGRIHAGLGLGVKEAVGVRANAELYSNPRTAPGVNY